MTGRACTLTFSIPYRIELAVTHGQPGEHHVPKSAFSIPYRIELAVTLAVRGPHIANSDFQYPLSDRTRCNSANS